ncbi:MAG TPA: galactokinase family protein [Blastocatellia bacterium]|nr:galactokinase family protein [Blastocatellia bacterium]
MKTRLNNKLASSGLSADEASNKAGLFVEARNALVAARSSSRDFHYWFVPGRIEFLGKHTDYCGGRSLICALERGFCVVASPRDDDRIQIIDAKRSEQTEISLTADEFPRTGHWSGYPATVARRIAYNFPGKLRGADIAFISDLPAAAGLSSSSALIVAIFSVLARLNALAERDEYKSNIHNLEDLAGYLGAVENGSSYGSLEGGKGVGTFGGSQDHTAILCSQPGKLSQYSFCPVRLERTISQPDHYAFVIAVSGVTAEKTGAALEKYNRVSLRAAEVLALWRSVTAQADATLWAAASSSPDASSRIRELLLKSRSSSFSPKELIDRFDQLILECGEIIPGAADALAAGNIQILGDLVDQSQRAAERLLGNQVPETVALARLARELGAAAASAFGAGFGGSVWALVEAERADSLMSEWSSRYRSQFPLSAERSTFFLTRAGSAMIQFENAER